MSKLFEIFKAGKYPQGDYPEDKVRAIFENYDPAWFKAPFTVEHAKSGPAFGYVETLEFSDGKLKASADDINEQLKELIKAKNFGPVSVEIFREVDKEGKKIPYLGAVSFLGVKPPAIKGMELVSFSETPFSEKPASDVVCFNVQQGEEPEEIELVPMTDEEVSAFNEQREAESKSKKTAELLAALRSKIDELKTDRDGLLAKFTATDEERQVAENKLRDINLNQRRLEFEAWLNERIAYGNLSSKQKKVVMKLRDALDTVAHFSEEHEGIVDVFKEMITSYPKQVEFSEIAVKEHSDIPQPGDDAVALAGRAREFRDEQLAKGIHISFTQAMNHIKSNPT